MSYIDREQLIDMFQQLAHDDWNQRVSTTWANAYSDATEMVRDIPSADVEPVRHGHWIMLHKTHGVDEDSDYDWRCSKCNHVDCHNISVEVPYCWHCGSRMDEVSE